MMPGITPAGIGPDSIGLNLASTAVKSIFGGSAMPVGPAISSATGAPVTVSVGGLNVPTYPNFTAPITNDLTGQKIQAVPLSGQLVQAVTGASKNKYLIAAGVIVFAFLLKARKK